jgi:hypothetical protein
MSISLTRRILRKDANKMAKADNTAEGSGQQSTIGLKGPVGDFHGKISETANARQDVRLVKELLNSAILGAPLEINSLADKQLMNAIKYFQSKQGFKPDGRMSPNGETWRRLNAVVTKTVACVPNSQSLPMPSNNSMSSDGSLERAALVNGIDKDALEAVAHVESSGSGFLASGAPKIRFEAHVFSKLTDHVYDAKYQDISGPYMRHDTRVKGGEKEYLRLRKAIALDRDAAFRATSWGKFQIMGNEIGRLSTTKGNIESFVSSQYASEDSQLAVASDFMKHKQDQDGKSCIDHLRNNNFDEFARLYNGENASKIKNDHGETYADQIRSYRKKLSKSSKNQKPVSIQPKP